jgi:hypothetical protein
MARRRTGRRSPRISSTITAKTSAHWPIAPALIHEPAAAHGAQESEPQSNLSVQLLIAPKPTAKYPSVPSSAASPPASPAGTCTVVLVCGRRVNWFG